MGRVASDRCPLALIVTSLHNQGTNNTFPVERTFIHYDIHFREKRCVQRFKTEPPQCSRIGGLNDEDPKYRLPQVSATPDEAEICTSQTSTASGSSTPQTSAELSQPSDDPDEVNSSSGWITAPTPESSPCWAGVSTTSAALCTQPPTWAATVHPQVSRGFTFAFTHRRAQGVQWGIDVSRTMIVDSAGESCKALLVGDVIQGGAIDSWNRQVISTDGPMAVKVVQAGDLIVAVNDKRDWDGMVQESNSSILLKMKVFRQKSGL